MCLFSVDDDFSSSTIIVTVPANQNQGVQTFQLPKFFTVIDDNINEPDQVFAVIAEVGQDVPENYCCLLLYAGATDCFVGGGAARIIIKDNDRKLHITGF